MWARDKASKVTWNLTPQDFSTCSPRPLATSDHIQESQILTLGRGARSETDQTNQKLEWSSHHDMSSDGLTSVLPYRLPTWTQPRTQAVQQRFELLVEVAVYAEGPQ